jgi:hypothetical protein
MTSSRLSTGEGLVLVVCVSLGIELLSKSFNLLILSILSFTIFVYIFNIYKFNLFEKQF